MRRFLVISGFAFLLVSGILIAQQAPSTASPGTGHRKILKGQSTGKPDTEPPTRVEVFNGSTSQTQQFSAQPRNRGPHGQVFVRGVGKKGSNAEPAMTRVDVYNGASKQMQVFASHPAAPNPAKSSRKKPYRSHRNMAAMTSVSDVEIFNGTTKERRVFSGAPDEMTEHRNRQPVVVGISSSASEAKDKDAPRVVTAIVTSGSEDAGNAQPVIGVSPLPPKRPPYHPNVD